MLLHQSPDSIQVDADCFWADLVVIADNDALLAKVLKDEPFRSRLARLVHNYNVERAGLHLDGFRDSM